MFICEVHWQTAFVFPEIVLNASLGCSNPECDADHGACITLCWLFFSLHIILKDGDKHA